MNVIRCNPNLETVCELLLWFWFGEYEWV